MVPSSKPWVMQVSPERSLPSQISTPSRMSLPQLKATQPEVS